MYDNLPFQVSQQPTRNLPYSTFMPASGTQAAQTLPPNPNKTQPTFPASNSQLQNNRLSYVGPSVTATGVPSALTTSNNGNSIIYEPQNSNGNSVAVNPNSSDPVNRGLPNVENDRPNALINSYISSLNTQVYL